MWISFFTCCNIHFSATFCYRLKPRCSLCQELIFAGSYTRALNRNWHSHHFRRILDTLGTLLYTPFIEFDCHYYYPCKTDGQSFMLKMFTDFLFSNTFGDVILSITHIPIDRCRPVWPPSAEIASNSQVVMYCKKKLAHLTPPPPPQHPSPSPFSMKSDH